VHYRAVQPPERGTPDRRVRVPGSIHLAPRQWLVPRSSEYPARFSGPLPAVRTFQLSQARWEQGEPELRGRRASYEPRGTRELLSGACCKVETLST